MSTPIITIGTGVLGFVTEENNSGSFTVFVPSSPAITVGKLCVVDREQVTILEAGTKDFVDCVSTWGVGSRELIGDKAIKDLDRVIELDPESKDKAMSFRDRVERDHS